MLKKKQILALYFGHLKLFSLRNAGIREMECLNWGFPRTRRHPVKGIKGQAHVGQRQCPVRTLHIRKTQTDTVIYTLLYQMEYQDF